MRRMLCRGVAALVCSILATTAEVASADSITTFLTEFTGDPITVKTTLDDSSAGAGSIEVTVEVVGTSLGDIRGVFLNLNDDSLLSGLSVVGDDVSGWDFSGNVSDLGNGSNLHGGGSPCPCDLGVEIGSQGLGENDIGLTSFVLSHDSESLTLALFAGEEIGVRVTSVGPEGDREGSSKTVALIPEPSTAILLLAGLLGLGLPRPRFRA